MTGTEYCSFSPKRALGCCLSFKSTPILQIPLRWPIFHIESRCNEARVLVRLRCTDLAARLSAGVAAVITGAWCSPDRNSHQRRSPEICPHGGEPRWDALRYLRAGLKFLNTAHCNDNDITVPWARSARGLCAISGAWIYYTTIIVVCTQRDSIIPLYPRRAL